eukprot:3997662-Pleurochrysis_carterae.AAC.1
MPRLAGADRPTDQIALGPQPEGRQRAARAGGPALSLKGVAPGEERGLPGRLEPQESFNVEPMAAKIEELNAENQRLRDEVTELKGITGLGKEYFHRDGFTLAVNLAIADAITTAHVSRNQVPALFLIFARFFRIKLPTHRRK